MMRHSTETFELNDDDVLWEKFMCFMREIIPWDEKQLVQLTEVQKSPVLAFIYSSEVMGDGHIQFLDMYGKYIKIADVLNAFKTLSISDQYIKNIEEMPIVFVDELSEDSLSEEEETVMLVEHFTGKKECNNIEELESVLEIRSSNKANEFILTGENEYPYLILTVKENYAVINYMEEEGYAYIALRENSGLESDGTTVFYSGSETEEMEIDNDYILDFSQAKEVAKEFFQNMDLPQNVEWDEL